MEKDLEEDRDFQGILATRGRPNMHAIVSLARKRGITQVCEFWDLFDYVHRRYSEKYSYTSEWDNP